VSRLLLLTRPARAIPHSRAAARRAGFDTMAAPLLAIEPLPWTVPGGDFDGLLFTSAEAPPLVAGVPMLRDLPAFAVGGRTAAAARRAGFRVAGAGEADAAGAVRLAAAAGVTHLLHPGGAHRAGFAIPVGLSVAAVPVYRARLADSLPDAARTALATGDIFATMLFSARTATCFARLADAAGLRRNSLRLAVLSPAVAQAAGSGWDAVGIARRPTLGEALAAAERLWQGQADG
jgi:uroporphyrinogen-III synthase